MTLDRAGGGFRLADLPPAEMDEIEGYTSALASGVRDLVDATIRTTANRAEVEAARATIEAVTARLRAEQVDGPAGISYTPEGRSWQWGNAAVGVRNALAPPLVVHDGRDDAGLGPVFGDVVLGAAYEGPPGCVHGGVLALMLDHLMGVTASSRQRPTMTGTLTLRYRRATPLGPVRIEGRVDRDEGVKTVVIATVSAGGHVTVEAEGIFVMPRWAR